MEGYKGLVFTEETQADAKRYRANLNKLIDAIKGFVSEEKKKALAEFESTTKKQADELLAIIIPCRDEIDAQEKAISDFKRNEKLAQIKAEIYTPLIGNLAELIPYDKLHNPKWLNVTMSMASISEDMARTVDKVITGLAAIDKLNLAPNIAERVKSVFLRNFDLAAAIAEKDKIEADREKLERYQAAQQAQDAPTTAQTSRCENIRPADESPTASAEQPATDEKVYTVEFRIHVTKAQLDGLGAYMKANGIKPERI